MWCNESTEALRLPQTHGYGCRHYKWKLSFDGHRLAEQMYPHTWQLAQQVFRVESSSVMTVLLRDVRIDSLLAWCYKEAPWIAERL